MNANELSDLIRRRRAIFPKTYVQDRPIDREVIEQLLENARWAPSHRLTEPWRFVVFHSAESRTELANYLADFLRANTPPESFTEEKWEKARENPLRSGAVIALVLQRDAEQRVPEWEEIAALAMAVQNLWLSCTALNLGGYWSTPRAALEATDFLHLQEGQRCLGLFYLGWHEMPEIAGKRKPVEANWR